MILFSNASSKTINFTRLAIKLSENWLMISNCVPHISLCIWTLLCNGKVISLAKRKTGS